MSSSHDSSVQQKMEAKVLHWFGQEIGKSLTPYSDRTPQRLVKFDGWSGSAPGQTEVIVEVYARVSKMKSGSLRKCTGDILKLATHAREIVGADGRTVFLCSQQVARQLENGWAGRSAEMLGVEIVAFKLGPEDYEELRTAEKIQGSKFSKLALDVP